MKKKENYVTKKELKSVVGKTETKLIGMMGTLENRVNFRMDKGFDRLDAKIEDTRIETREMFNELCELMVKKFDSLETRMDARFDGLSDIYLTKKEFYAYNASR